MRNILLAFMIGLLSFTFIITDAEAKRFGGGRNFGVSRQMNKPAPAHQAHAQPTQKPQAAGKSWLGPLAGLAIGGLLATLFMGHGLGSGLLLWLLIAVVGFFIFRFIRNILHPSANSPPSPHSAANNANFQSPPSGAFSSPSSSAGPMSESEAAQTIPGFDSVSFLRQAKSLFIRLQAAYDAKNLGDIREFTTPEIFAEIQLQIQERSDQINQTEVISIDAQLMDLSGDPRNAIASVAFSGMIREEAGAQPIQIHEIWHFQRNIFNQKWMLAGIQQT